MLQTVDSDTLFAAAAEAADADDFFAAAAARKQQEQAAQAATATVDLASQRADDLPRVLAERLSKAWGKVSQLFRAWDSNGDGQVSRREFTGGLDTLGLPVSPLEVDAFFLRYDPDGSGKLSLREIEAAIRQVNPSVAAAADTPALSLGQGQARVLRKEPTNKRFSNLGEPLGDAGGGTEGVGAALKKALRANQARVIDLFNSFDVDGAQCWVCWVGARVVVVGWVEPERACRLCHPRIAGSGGINRREFGAALKELGFSAPPAEVHSPQTHRPDAPRNAHTTRTRAPGGRALCFVGCGRRGHHRVCRAQQVPAASSGGRRRAHRFGAAGAAKPRLQALAAHVRDGQRGPGGRARGHWR
jgi:hypothetical protein